MAPCIEIADYPAPDAIPARALLGQTGIFSTGAWYRATAAHAVPVGANASFLTFSLDDRVLASIPLKKGPGRTLGSLATPYTCLWQPLLAPDLSMQEFARIAARFAAVCRAYATVRLDAIDPAQPFWSVLKTAARAANLVPLTFDHFGNWYETVADGTTWESYLAARPGELREAIRRKTARIDRDASTRFEIVSSPNEVQQATASYQDIYASSWKKPEPFPDFIPAFMREAARSGALRLALLHMQGRPVAAQLWTVHDGTACLMKLAHRQEADALSPGTVLTAYTLRELIENSRIREVDFGRGDEPYKSLWTTRRRQRTGIVLANLATPAGMSATVRQFAGRLLKKARQHPG